VAWGKLTYTVAGPAFGFVFNGHKLAPDVEYTLIYYPDPFPGIGVVCLGSEVADADGDAHIMGSVVTGDLPISTDRNANPATTTVPGPPPVTGAKIWLVPSTDVVCNGGGMTRWQPGSYLFEMKLITYSQR
jgi:hypothetical protein